MEYPLEVAQAMAAEKRALREAGSRLAVMLRSHMTTVGYGSPEQEERCREALREWDDALASESQR